MKSYQVTGRPLTRGSKIYKVGDGIQFPAADGDALVEAGRLKVPTSTNNSTSSSKSGSDKK